MTAPIAPERLLRSAIFALVAFAIVNVALMALVLLAGNSLDNAFRSVAFGATPRLTHPMQHDSWLPMSLAAQNHERNPDADLYNMFFEGRGKFQYPPSALLVMDVVPSSMYSGEIDDFDVDGRLHKLLSYVALSACFLTMGVSFLILIRTFGWTVANAFKERDFWIWGVVVGVFGISFYPLVRSYDIGQIQVFLGLLLALALYAHQNGRRLLAGACVGLCCLVKPQYGIVLIWSLLRRDHKFSLGLLLAGGAGLALSLAQFGFQNHWRYVEVLAHIAARGESFWPNQSMNGLANRFFDNGSATEFVLYFVEEHAFVRTLTIVSSIAILGSALWPFSRAARAPARTEDFALALAASTMASPIAWEHHYGAFFAIFALCFPFIMRVKPAGRATGALLLVSYVAMASVMQHSELFYGNRWTGLLGSHIYLGSVLLFVLLFAARRRAYPEFVRGSRELMQPAADESSSADPA